MTNNRRTGSGDSHAMNKGYLPLLNPGKSFDATTVEVIFGTPILPRAHYKRGVEVEPEPRAALKCWVHRPRDRRVRGHIADNCQVLRLILVVSTAADAWQQAARSRGQQSYTRKQLVPRAMAGGPGHFPAHHRRQLPTSRLAIDRFYYFTTQHNE